MESQPHKLAYKEAGKGMPVVLVHGFCETKEIWNHFIPALAKHHRVIAIDLAGFGENQPLTHALTIGDMAEDVYHLLRDLQVEQCVMIGHSLGGYVSLAFAEKFSQRLRGLGLFHSTAHSDSIEKKQGRTKTIEFIDRYGVEEFVEEFVTPLFFEGRRKELKDAIKFVTDMGKNTPKSTVIEVIKAMRDRKDRTKVLEKATFPVLFIVGRNDTAVNFAHSSTQFMIPEDASIHILSSTGHMGMFEREKETLRIVKHFLEEIEAKI